MKSIRSKVIGELVQDNDFSDWWRSEEIEIPFFDKEKLPIIFMDFSPVKDNMFIGEADSALKNFLKLTPADRKTISHLAHKSCVESLESVELEDEELEKSLKGMEEVHTIWNFISPTEIFIARRNYKDKDMYIQVCCNCDWDEEHGIQFVFRQGRKLTRVSDQDGHLTDADAYDMPDSEDILLSKF